MHVMCLSLQLYLCVVVRVHGCRIYMCPIRIYTLCDSQYKSFYEHLYQSDGSLGTLALLGSDCYISVTALPFLVTLADKDIDRLYYSPLLLKPNKLLVSQQYSGNYDQAACCIKATNYGFGILQV